jgi:hypothetical protein
MTLFSFVFILTICAMARPALAQCESMTDAQIVAHVYGKINEDSGLKSQISHINVVGAASLAAVKLQGWADNQSDFDKVRNIAAGLKCLKVNVNNFEPAPPAADSLQRAARGCAPGTKPCGDICIPDGDPCNSEAGAKSSMFPMFRFDMDRSIAIFETVGSCDLD